LMEVVEKACNELKEKRELFKKQRSFMMKKCTRGPLLEMVRESKDVKDLTRFKDRAFITVYVYEDNSARFCFYVKDYSPNNDAEGLTFDEAITEIIAVEEIYSITTNRQALEEKLIVGYNEWLEETKQELFKKQGEQQ